MFLVAKHNKVCFYPFKPLADETNRTDTGRFNFSRATTEGREEFCFLFPLLSWDREWPWKKIIGATCKSETIPSFSSYAQEMSIFVHVSRWNSIELSRINVEARQDMLNFRRSLVSCRQSTSLLCRLERLVMEPKFVTVTRSDRKRS